jgi:hypothetical protein
MTTEHEKIAAQIQGSLNVFARLREHMRTGGPGAVAGALNTMPDDDVRQVLFALVGGDGACGGR